MAILGAKHSIVEVYGKRSSLQPSNLQQPLSTDSGPARATPPTPASVASAVANSANKSTSSAAPTEARSEPPSDAARHTSQTGQPPLNRHPLPPRPTATTSVSTPAPLPARPQSTSSTLTPSSTLPQTNDGPPRSVPATAPAASNRNDAQVLSHKVVYPSGLRANGSVSATVQHARDKFVVEQITQLELRHLQPVKLIGAPTFGQLLLEFQYRLESVGPDVVVIQLPEDCRSTAAASVGDLSSSRERFKVKQIVEQTRQGKNPEGAATTHGLLLITIAPLTSTSSSEPQSTTPAPQAATAPSNPAAPNRAEIAPHSSTSLRLVKREDGLPGTDAPMREEPAPSTPVFQAPRPPRSSAVPSVPARRPVSFPFNIRNSYAETPHARSHVENFLRA